MHRTKFEIKSSLGYHLTRPEMEKQNTLAKRSVAICFLLYAITINILILINKYDNNDNNKIIIIIIIIIMIITIIMILIRFTVA